ANPYADPRPPVVLTIGPAQHLFRPTSRRNRSMILPLWRTHRGTITRQPETRPGARRILPGTRAPICGEQWTRGARPAINIRGLDVVHCYPVIGERAGAHFGERATVENVGDGVARVDHHEADRAGGEVGAILARAKRGDRGAGNGSERPVEGAHDRADGDLLGRARESVPAALALLGVDETGVPEFGQDMIEELLRNRIGFS